MAVKVVDVALREDFGFEHIMWVYSGRRGAHAWISDRKARNMDDARRKAVAGYLEVIKGGSQSGKKVNVKRPLHPHLLLVLLIFVCILADQTFTDEASTSSRTTFKRIFSRIRILGQASRKPIAYSSSFPIKSSMTPYVRSGIRLQVGTVLVNGQTLTL